MGDSYDDQFSLQDDTVIEDDVLSHAPDGISGERLVPLVQCENAAAASVLCNRLKHAGIPAFVQGAELTTMLSYIGTAIATVRVEVAESHLERATQLLQEDEQAAAQRTAWTCGRCDQVNEPAFELCWKCYKRRDDLDDEARPPGDEPESVEGSDPTVDRVGRERTLEDLRRSRANPYAVDADVSLGGDVSHVPASDGNAASATHQEDGFRRAYWACVIGFFALPPLLHFYSLYYLLTEARSARKRDGRTRWGYWCVLAVDLLMIGLAGGYLFRILG
ncbi:MAG: DUF2007 domain-containing protein [Planctomycetota bacterium]